MGYQKLQVGRATDMDNLLSDVSDTVTLNDVITSGNTGAGTSGDTLVDTTKDFIALGVRPGMILSIVGSALTSPSCAIASVETTSLTLTNDIGIGSSSTYNILAEPIDPAVLYVGTAAAGATLKVRSAGGDDATFVNIQQGSFIPVQVKRVYNTGTTATNIVALF